MNVLPVLLMLTTAPIPVTSTVSPDMTVGRLEFKVLGQYWARFVADGKRDFLDSGGAEYVGQRARLGLDIRDSSGVTFRVLAQDVRTWGESTNTLNDFSADGFDLHEAFIDVPLVDVGHLRVGRQEYALGNHRLVGTVAWTLRARSFDGAKLMLGPKDLSGTAFYAKLEEKDQNPDGTVPAGRTTDNNLGVAHLHWAFAEEHQLGAMYVLRGDGRFDVTVHTAGLVFDGRIGSFDYHAEGFGQFGRRNGESTSAFLAAGNVGYRFREAPLAPALRIGVDALSSDGTVSGTFDTLFATNHKFYGEMDLFLDIPRHTIGLGLIDVYAQVKIMPAPSLEVQLTLHDFSSYARPDVLGRRFGDEVDLSLHFPVFDHVELIALYGLFVPGDLMQGRFGVSADRLEHFVYTTLALDLN